MADEEGGTTLSDLDDACMCAVLSQLDARTLANVQQTDKRSALLVSTSDLLWRGVFAKDFPAHYQHLQQRPGDAPAGWRALYRGRHLRESRWQQGRCSALVERLRAHSGPIFSTRFLEAPFPPGFAISGGVYGQNEAAEVVLWDLGRPNAYVGRLGWLLLSSPAAMANLCGVFDLRQVPNSAQVLCCGFGPEVNVGALECKPPDSSVDAMHETNLGLLPSLMGRGAADASVTRDVLPQGEAGWGLRHTHTLVGHDAACPAVVCTREGLAATASFDGTLRLWRVPGESPVEEGGGGAGGEPAALTALAVLRDPFLALDNPIFHSNAVCSAALSSDGQHLASGGNDMQVKQWDVEAGRVSLRLAGHEGWVWHVEALDEAHHTLVSGGTDSSVRVWDTRAGRQTQRVNVCTETLYPIAGLCLRPPDDKYIVCGVFDGSVHVVDRRQMRVLYALEGHSDRVTRVACDGDSILSGSFDAQVNLWSF